MASEFKRYWKQFNKGDAEDLEWITVHGTHIPIKPGQSKDEAVHSVIDNNSGHASNSQGQKNSRDRHTDPKTHDYTPERKKLHNDIVEATLASAKSSATPVAHFVTGHSASGKSKFYKDVITKYYKDLAEMNVDNIKEKLGGNTPEYHDEGGDVMQQLMEKAIEQHKHFAYNGIIKDTPKYQTMLAKLKQRGYNIDADVVATDLKTALQRAKERSERTGQVVPEDEIKDNHAKFTLGVDLLKNYTKPNYYDGTRNFEEQYKDKNIRGG
jgi:predicted ABC-type ATPase